VLIGSPDDCRSRFLKGVGIAAGCDGSRTVLHLIWPVSGDPSTGARSNLQGRLDLLLHRGAVRAIRDFGKLIQQIHGPERIERESLRRWPGPTLYIVCSVALMPDAWLPEAPPLGMIGHDFARLGHGATL
jgi:hypothetical protein